MGRAVVVNGASVKGRKVGGWAEKLGGGEEAYLENSGMVGAGR